MLPIVLQSIAWVVASAVVAYVIRAIWLTIIDDLNG